MKEIFYKLNKEDEQINYDIPINYKNILYQI